MKKLSVVCTAYNIENYIEECINSVLCQTFKDFELIIVDDGSTDGTGKFLDGLKDERVKVIHKENSGSVLARATGLKEASCDSIIFLDGDDWIEDFMFEKMMKLKEDNDADIVITSFVKDFSGKSEDFQNFPDSGVYKNETLKEVLNTAFYKGNFYESGIAPALWHKLFKKSLIEKLILETDKRVSMGDDACTTYPALLDAKCIVIDNSVKAYHYRINESSLSNKFDSRYFEKLFYLKESLLNRIKERNGKLFEEQFLLYISFLLDLGFKQYLNYSIEDDDAKAEYLKNQFEKFPVLENVERTRINEVPEDIKKEIDFLDKKDYKGLSMFLGRKKEESTGGLKGLAKKKVMDSCLKSAGKKDAKSFEGLRKKLWNDGHYNFVRKLELERVDKEKASLDPSNLNGVLKIENGLYDYEYFNICFLNEMISKSLDAVLEGKLPRVELKNSEGVNIWELFFKQPFSEIKEDGLKVFAKADVDSGILARWDSLYSKDEVRALGKLYNSYAVFNDETKKYIDKEIEEILKPKQEKGKIVAVLLRGTDYIKLKPKGHPIQPEIKDVMDEVDELLEKDYSFVYLATEDGRIDKIFREHYKDKLIINKRQYYDECYKDNNLLFIKDVHFERENDDYLKGLEYLSSLAIVSKCDAFVGGNSGGTEAAVIFNGGKFEYCHIFNLGLY